MTCASIVSTWRSHGIAQGNGGAGERQLLVLAIASMNWLGRGVVLARLLGA